MKHTNTASSLHRCRKALVVAAALFGAGVASAQSGPSGTIDPNFAAGLKKTNFFAGNDAVRALAALPDGRFVAAGVAVGPNVTGPGATENLAVARYLSNGELDTTFATNGKFHFDLTAGNDRIYSIRALPDRSLLVAGELAPGAYSDFGLAKLRPNGTLDDTFGMQSGAVRTGYVRLDVAGPSVHDEGRALAVQLDGKIILAGNTFVPVGGFSYRRTTVARFTADGRIDTTFGPNGTGYVVLPGMLAADAQTSDYVSSIALTQSGQLESNDSIVISGYTDSRNNAYLIRLTRDGALDPAFGAGTGRVIVTDAVSGGVRTGVGEIRAARIDNAGRIVAVGSAGDRGFAFLRFNANGTPDTTFGTNGRTLVKWSGASNYDQAAALALQGNGKIVAVGFAPNVVAGQTTHEDFLVVRLQANGQPDPSFAGDPQGRKLVVFGSSEDLAAAVIVEPSGNILVGGSAQANGSTTTDFAITRLYGDSDRLFFDSFDPPVF